MEGLSRSLIFVPGNNPRFLKKSKSLPADIICLDLEDSVPYREKSDARDLIRDALQERSTYASTVYVRTNSLASGELSADLEAIVRDGVDGIVVPKVNNRTEMEKIEQDIARIEKSRGLSGAIPLAPSIESAEGVVNCYGIASYSRRVNLIVFGVFDLLHDLGIEYTKEPEGARYARAKIPLDASAAGVAAIDAIWQDLDDMAGLERDSRMGRSLGYAGKSIIHPSHIPVVHKAFHPNTAEVEWAQKVIAAYELSVMNGQGATTVDGRMIDRVHYDRAVALLAVAKG